MRPGLIRLRGYPIEDLIGRVCFPAMIWLMLRGELPSEAQADLLGAALGAAVDHGPQAPSIAIARMAATCGVGINCAMASAINVLGDVHGGAGERRVAFYGEIAAAMDGGLPLEEAVAARLDRFFAEEGGYVPGFGHRFHPVDPRAPRLLALAREAAAAGTVSGRFADIAEAVERRDRGPQGQAHPAQHRRRHRRDLRRARLPAAADPRPVRPVPLRRHPGARLGAVAAGRSATRGRCRASGCGPTRGRRSEGSGRRNRSGRCGLHRRGRSGAFRVRAGGPRPGSAR